MDFSGQWSGIFYVGKTVAEVSIEPYILGKTDRRTGNIPGKMPYTNKFQSFISLFSEDHMTN